MHELLAPYFVVKSDCNTFNNIMAGLKDNHTVAENQLFIEMFQCGFCGETFSLFKSLLHGANQSVHNVGPDYEEYTGRQP